MKISAVIVALAPVLASLGVAVDGASGATTDGATTDIGAVGEIRAGDRPSAIAAGGFTVQVAEASGSYAVPPGYGMITTWSHSTGTAPGPLTFKVYRPTGTPRQFLTIASDTRTVTANTVQSFPVQIAVRPGDRIGLSTEDVQVAYASNDPGDRIGFFGSDPPPGTTRSTDGDPFQDFKLDVAATLESDPDAPNGIPVGAPAPGSLPPSPSSASPLPAAEKLRVAPRTFTAARNGPSALATKRRASGAKVTYSVNVRATMRFTVRQARPGRRQARGQTARCVPETKLNRKAAPCTRTVTLPGHFTQLAKAAANSFGFTGRLSGKPLKPGAYTLIATPSVSGRNGRSATSRFHITR